MREKLEFIVLAAAIISALPTYVSVAHAVDYDDAADVPGVIQVPLNGVRWGTNGDDVIRGTEGNDMIFGKSGNDIICGMGGHDFIVTANGDDIVYGGPGNDSAVNSLDGVVGNDSVDGGSGVKKCVTDPDPTVNCE